MSLYESLVAKRRKKAEKKALLERKLVDHVRIRYAAFDAVAPRFDVGFVPGTFISKKKGKLLAKLYAAVRTELRETALERQRDDSDAFAHRQLCGLNEPSTLDHYLGKKDFLEYYVHARNLIPSCGVCNYPRDTFDASGQRRIIHLFTPTDVLLPQLFDAVVSIRGRQPRATFDLKPLSGDHEQLFGRHWNALRLKRRYERLAPSELAGIARRSIALLKRTPMNASQLARNFEEEASQLDTTHGPNYWKAALYRGAARSNPFLQTCGVP